MKKILPILLTLSFLIASGCTDSVSDLNTDDILVTADETDLIIRNNFNHSIYYFAVDAFTAVYIQWAPISTDENRIKSGRTKQIPLHEIYAFEPDDEILFYYWSVKEPANSDVKFQRIRTE